jgi:hypothetical protein
MTADEREKLASSISKEAIEHLVNHLLDHPNIMGLHGLGWRGTTDLESEIYGFLMDHATFRSNREEDLPSLEDVRGIFKPKKDDSRNDHR